MDCSSTHSSCDLTCSTCGGNLTSGPFGLRCIRCVLSLVDAPENDEDGYVAGLFQELRLEGKVARGGFGTVYRAEHRRMRRTVALKFLDSLLARNAEAVALFEQEMISVGGLDHPGIVRAHDAGERDGHWYMIMEFVDGMDCGALVRKHGKLPVAESCEIIRQAALALHHAHGQGLVHRDVKPGNVMVSREEGTKGTDRAQGTADVINVPSVLSVPFVTSTVKVLDFGLAGLAVAPVFSQPVATAGSTLFLGTLEYISPEQIENPAAVDLRADIYSLGATLWRLITGKPPHGGVSAERSLFAAMKRITTEPVPSIATVRPDLPRPLILLCDAMLSLGREKRPASAAEVARLIEPWCTGAELPRLFTDGPLEEKPFVFPKKNRRTLWVAAAVAAVLASAAAMALMFANAPPEHHPLFPAAYFEAQKLSPDYGPRLFSNAWEPESVAYDITHKQYGRLAPDGAVLSVDAFLDDSIRRWDGRHITAPFSLPEKRPEIRALGVALDGHVVWALPGDKTGHHIGRARPDGTLLPTLRYDFGSEFGLGFYEVGRQVSLKMNLPVADGEPRGFAFVTPENLPANTGLRPGDVIVADYGQREFSAGIKKGTGVSVGEMWSIPGLWRFRLDNDVPARRLAKASPAVMPLDVTISKHGVFIIDRAFHNPDTESDDPRHLTDHVWRWDLTGWHSCTTDIPLLTPCGIAADPLSTDLYVLCGDENLSRSSDRQSLLRLAPAGRDRYTVTPIVTRLGKADRGGIAFSYDGTRLVLTDSGNRVIVVLKRSGTSSTTIPPKQLEQPKQPKQPKTDAPPEIPGWKVATNLHHHSPFTSPQFLPGSLALYCTNKFRLRIVEKQGISARDFLDEKTLGNPTFSGVSPLTGHIAWTQTKDSLQPGIGRATPDGKLLPSLKFVDTAPLQPGSFAFVTEANLPPGTPLHSGDVLVAGSRHPQHADSTSGLWRFRFDNDEPATRLVAAEDANVIDITVSKVGVFLLTDSGIQRWDGTALHAITTSERLERPIAMAADPLSSDIYLLETNRLLRLRPSGTETSAVEVLTTEITHGVPAGLCFSGDGKRLLVGDFGRNRTWVLERKD